MTVINSKIISTKKIFPRKQQQLIMFSQQVCTPKYITLHKVYVIESYSSVAARGSTIYIRYHTIAIDDTFDLWCIVQPCLIQSPSS